MLTIRRSDITFLAIIVFAVVSITVGSWLNERTTGKPEGAELKPAVMRKPVVEHELSAVIEAGHDGLYFQIHIPKGEIK